MRRFRVYLSHGTDKTTEIEFDDNASDEEIEYKCAEEFQIMISNLDSGWYEIKEEEDK